MALADVFSVSTLRRQTAENIRALKFILGVYSHADKVATAKLLDSTAPTESIGDIISEANSSIQGVAGDNTYWQWKLRAGMQPWYFGYAVWGLMTDKVTLTLYDIQGKPLDLTGLAEGGDLIHVCNSEKLTEADGNNKTYTLTADGVFTDLENGLLVFLENYDMETPAAPEGNDTTVEIFLVKKYYA